MLNKNVSLHCMGAIVYKELLISLLALVLMCTVVEMTKNRELVSKYILISLIIGYWFMIAYLTLFYQDRKYITGYTVRCSFPLFDAVINRSIELSSYESFLNLILFIPFGYLLSNFLLLFSLKINWWQVALSGFVTSFIIEISQLFFQRGAYEIDDLIMNTVGAVLGFLLYWIFEFNRNRQMFSK